MDISGGIPDSGEVDLLLPVGHLRYRHSVFSVILSLCRAVGAVAFHSRIPEVTAAPTLSSTFRWVILMVQSIHRLRAGRWLRVLSKIGVGNLIFAIRVRKSVAPSENAPVKDIPIRDTVGAPPLLLFKSRNRRRVSSFSSCRQKLSHAFAYVCALVRSFVLSCLEDP